jgi:uncharacterized Tic20 family protein
MENPPPAPSPNQPPSPDSPEARRWITILHVSALSGFLIVGLGQILVPLVLWLIKKNDVPGLDAAGKEVLNFQISWTLWWFLSWGLFAVGWCLILPILAPAAVLIAWVVLGANGAIKASNGVSYRFPLTIRFFN